MGKKYNKAPLNEALCEFRFLPSEGWEPAFSHRIQSRLAHIFPKKRMVQSFEATFAIVPQEANPSVKTTDRLQALREDESALIQVEEGLLAINHLRPYLTWEQFRPLIIESLDAYLDVAKPKGIHRVTLRYINQIEIPGTEIQLEDYFNFYPAINVSAGDSFSAFIIGAQFPFDEGLNVLNLQMTSTNPGTVNGSQVVVFTLEYFSGKSGELPFSDISKWLEQSHSRIEESFEGSITDELRKIFDEVK